MGGSHDPSHQEWLRTLSTKGQINMNSNRQMQRKCGSGRASLHTIAMFSAWAALAGAAHAGQPPDIVVSDGLYNTAMGTDALASLTSGYQNTASGAFALYADTTGFDNTALGTNALANLSSGVQNTASGAFALGANTIGSYNTASGYDALSFNTSGSYNTANGSQALLFNTTGSYNTAAGWGALESNTTGSYNTANGVYALIVNTTGYDNTASGYQALFTNTTGTNNTATGAGTLYANITGGDNSAYGANAMSLNSTGGGNSAFGSDSLVNNASGDYNSAFGMSALSQDTTGWYNTGVGASALYGNTTGKNNIAVGYYAGYNLTAGSNNIEIGNEGNAGDTGIIRIGTAGTQTATYIAGIVDSKLTGNEVVITASGQLGVKASSERYKTDIAPMGSVSENLRQLRPVSFHLKSNPGGDVQYGLIAEEVVKVYPELVIRDAKGRIDGVRYDELAPMLLNEVQKEQAHVVAQDEIIAAQNQKIVSLEGKHDADAAKIASLERKVAEVNDQQQQLSAAIRELKVRDIVVAQR
jgi:hypothetical protein